MIRVIGEAIKVAIIVWTVLAVDPWLSATLPDLGQGWRYLATAALSATLLEFALQVFVGWPTISIDWSDKDEPSEIRSIVARVREASGESQVFVLRISSISRGWLGYQLLKFWMRLSPTLQIRIDRASAKASVDHSTETETGLTIRPDTSFSGVSVDLGPAPLRAGAWHWAEVRWVADGAVEGVERNIDYVLHHSNVVLRFILKAVVWKSASVRHFQAVRN